MNGRTTLSVQDCLDASSIPCPASGCILWMKSLTDRGYARITIQGRGWRAHRLAWIIAKGPVPEGLEVCHKCDVRLCINPDHLFVGTHNDNVQDMMRKGRHRPPPRKIRPPRKPRVIPVGEMTNSAKLTEVLVRQIIIDTRTYRKIAREYGVCATTIGEIKRRQIWRHLDIAQ